MRIKTILTLVLLITCNILSQQDRVPRDFPGDQEKFGMSSVRVDLINFPSLDTLKSRIGIIFDIPQSFLVFLRDPGQGTEYTAIGEMSIEVLDTNKHSVTRQITQKKLVRQSPLPENDILQQSIIRTVWFNLDPGTYDFIVEVNDLQSTRRFHQTFRKILKDFRCPAALSDILILSPDSTDGKVIRPLFLGGDALFGKDFKIYFELHPEHDTLRNISVKFFRYEHHPTEKNLTFSDSIPSLILNSSQIGIPANDSITAIPLVPPADGIYSAIIQIHGDQIRYGRYMLEIRCLNNGKKLTFGKLMDIRWPSMPRSLMLIDYAVDMLGYELSKNEFDSLKALNREEKTRAFEKYWKSKDPTQGTAYNEALEEYYRRVDYAQTAYTSVKFPDGAKTDRGKISILFGIPSKPERLFPTDSAPFEIWTYPELHKRFIFVDESRNGSYSLIRIEHI